MKDKLAGVNSIMEAIKGKRKVHRIYIQEGRGGKRIEELIKLAEKRGIYWQYVEKSRLDQLYTLSNHQGVVAQVDSFQYVTVGEILESAALKNEKPFILILDGMEDPQNLGSIIRSAECAGVHGVIIPRHNSAEISPAVARASAGAVEHMLIARETNLVNCIHNLKEQGLWIIGCDMEGQQNYYNYNFSLPAALVLGGEGKGIRRLVKENCDVTVRIPMAGQVNSLNASVAAGIMIFEVLRCQNQ